MQRRISGDHRSRSRHTARSRRLAFTRLEDRQMLSADGFWSAPPSAPSDYPYQFATNYDKNETFVVMVAPDAGAGSESPEAEGKVVEQYVVDALTNQTHDNADRGGVLVLEATDTTGDSVPGKSDQAMEVAQSNAVPAPNQTRDALSAHDVSAIIHAARTDLIADEAAQSSEAGSPGKSVAEMIVVVREPDGGVAGVGVVFDSVGHHDLHHGSPAGSANMLAASLSILPATNPQRSDEVAAPTAFVGGDDAGGKAAAVAASSNANPQARADADARPESVYSGSRSDTRSQAEDDASPSEAEISKSAMRSGAATTDAANDSPINQALPSRREDSHAVHDTVRDTLFASLAENAGNLGAWLQLYALPRNLVSLENAIQTLLAECQDVDQVIGDWLLEPGAQPWLEWAAVAFVAAEAARRRSRRQEKERAATALDSQQLLHLFPELFGLAYGA